ncbi:chemotaxis protein CheW [Ramlibacter sp.]|uniref:chemotaxis protein CheW n=1 Tax=Ramlibacter sp. TaxID=1917967 RepID=UPI002C4E054A|nr:chemotaxis protein CheW [Ramlibacter sp.]HWI84176.1 chemotaxis protein CheW [Ramlibacter sp.]
MAVQPRPVPLLAPTQALLRGFVFEAAPASAAAAGPDAAERGPLLREGFRIGDLHLMIRYEDGSELTDLPPVYRLPRAPAWFLGMANLHGALVPVFDPAGLFGVAHDAAAKPMLLVLGHGDERAGVVIDGLPVRLRVAADDLVENAALPARLAACGNGSWRSGGADWLDLQVPALLSQLNDDLAAGAGA